MLWEPAPAALHSGAVFRTAAQPVLLHHWVRGLGGSASTPRSDGDWEIEMTPTADPNALDGVAEALVADDYEPGQRIWVHRAGSWRPGVVLHRSPRAVTIRYRPADGPGTGVDTVTARSLTLRDDDDPGIDDPIFSGVGLVAKAS